MHKKVSEEYRCSTFLTIYRKEIAPKLEKIDIFLRENDVVTVPEASECLEIPSGEVIEIMNNHCIDSINRGNFYLIMKSGSSPICRLFKRELECGSPHIYSIESISYIYGLETGIVEQACDSLGITDITSSALPIIFSKILLFYK